MDSTTTRTDNQNYRLEILSNNLLYIRYLPDCEITLPVIQEMVREGNELMKHQEYYSLVDTKNSFGNITKEAKQYLANSPELNDINLANAIMINTLAMRIVIRTYIKIDKPIQPAKIFKSEVKALEWLGSLGANIEEALKRFS